MLCRCQAFRAKAPAEEDKSIRCGHPPGTRARSQNAGPAFQAFVCADSNHAYGEAGRPAGACSQRGIRAFIYCLKRLRPVQYYRTAEAVIRSGLEKLIKGFFHILKHINPGKKDIRYV